MILKDALIREAIETNISKDEICNYMTYSYRMIDSHWRQMLAEKEREGNGKIFDLGQKKNEK